MSTYSEINKNEKIEFSPCHFTNEMDEVLDDPYILSKWESSAFFSIVEFLCLETFIEKEGRLRCISKDDHGHTVISAFSSLGRFKLFLFEYAEIWPLKLKELRLRLFLYLLSRKIKVWERKYKTFNEIIICFHGEIPIK